MMRHEWLPYFLFAMAFAPPGRWTFSPRQGRWTVATGGAVPRETRGTRRGSPNRPGRGGGLPHERVNSIEDITFIEVDAVGTQKSQ
jgi:hypothetical protein